MSRVFIWRFGILVLCLSSLPVQASGNCSLAFTNESPLQRYISAERSPLRLQDYSHLSLAISIPIYNEWRNQNLRILLKAFSRIALPGLKTKLVFVINHSPEIAEQKTDIYEDNRSSYDYLTSLQKGEPGNAEVETLSESLRKNQIELEIVDLTTEGIPRNIGRLRQMGMDRALSLHQGSKDNLILATFDADSLPPIEYREEIARSFSDPAREAAAFFMQFRIPRGSDPRLHASHYLNRGFYGSLDLHFAMRHSNLCGGSPRIVVRASFFEKIGGFEYLDEGEDANLLERMHLRTRVQVLWANPVLTADRARPDGYDANHRWRGLKDYKFEMQEPINSQIHRSWTQEYARLARLFDELTRRMPLSMAKLCQRELEFYRRRMLAESILLSDQLRDDASTIIINSSASPQTRFDNPWEIAGNANFWEDGTLTSEQMEHVRRKPFWREHFSHRLNDQLSIEKKVHLYVNTLARIVAFYYENVAPKLSTWERQDIETVFDARRLDDTFDTLRNMVLQDIDWRRRSDLLSAVGRALVNKNFRLGRLIALFELTPKDLSTEQMARFPLLLLDIIHTTIQHQVLSTEQATWLFDRYCSLLNYLLEFPLQGSVSRAQWLAWLESLEGDPDRQIIALLAIPPAKVTRLDKIAYFKKLEPQTDQVKPQLLRFIEPLLFGDTPLEK